ncbi:hypothetical protein DPMN_026171 [Dreissena polymorpha]|uniref:Uncharacterized protein n=1 Tax=Dreissena polymorpha TaxID=45954 RepID=A0A9D4RCB6_DREPO|nr:hypothetical protein DPMN_026171 [Dreissena polymorpha]
MTLKTKICDQANFVCGNIRLYTLNVRFSAFIITINLIPLSPPSSSSSSSSSSYTHVNAATRICGLRPELYTNTTLLFKDFK